MLCICTLKSPPQIITYPTVRTHDVLKPVQDLSHTCTDYQQDHFIHRTVTQAFVTLTQHKASVSQEEAVSHKIEWCLWSYSTRNTCIQLEGQTTHVVNNDLKCPPTLLFHA